MSIIPHAVLLQNFYNSFSSYLAILVEGRQKKERSQKIDNLPVLATCQSGTLAMLSSEVDDPLLMEALDKA